MSKPYRYDRDMAALRGKARDAKRQARALESALAKAARALSECADGRGSIAARSALADPLIAAALKERT